MKRRWKPENNGVVNTENSGDNTESGSDTKNNLENTEGIMAKTTDL